MRTASFAVSSRTIARVLRTSVLRAALRRKLERFIAGQHVTFSAREASDLRVAMLK